MGMFPFHEARGIRSNRPARQCAAKLDDSLEPASYVGRCALVSSAPPTGGLPSPHPHRLIFQIPLVHTLDSLS